MCLQILGEFPYMGRKEGIRQLNFSRGPGDISLR
jgi:hypothetical protein